MPAAIIASFEGYSGPGWRPDWNKRGDRDILGDEMDYDEEIDGDTTVPPKCVVITPYTRYRMLTVDKKLSQI